MPAPTIRAEDSWWICWRCWAAERVVGLVEEGGVGEWGGVSWMNGMFVVEERANQEIGLLQGAWCS